METFKTLLSGLLALILVAAVGIGLYQAFHWIVGYLDALHPELAPILGASVLGVLFLGWLLRWTRNRKNEIRLRLQKAEVYHRFLTAWSQVLQSRAAGTEAELKTAEHGLLLWASSAVLRAYAPVRELRRTPQTREEFWAVEKIVKTMRADMGRHTVGLKTGELVNLVVGGADSLACGEKTRRFQPSAQGSET